tara:strand:- start:12899 stop:13060 length:162 start_codon:yes stop_codon:yes gene_type:complete
MMMYYKGTKPIDVHPTKVDEMLRKGWSLEDPNKKGKKSSKTAGDTSKPVGKKE